MEFSHSAVEKKWQKLWEESQANITTNNHDKKAFVLDMFPYPSGAGLHVGHVKGYTATDAFARYKRMRGYDVLHPIGWDAFGLPAEQYAIQTGNDPREFTLKNIDTFRQQLKRLGFSYDFDKEVNTANPNYYKITQQIFQEFYRLGLAELRDVEVNWSPDLNTVLANDEVVTENGQMFSERGHFPVEKRKMRQWVLKITKYADQLLQGLDELDWPQAVKDLQKNWIGKSQGYIIEFTTENDSVIPVFTTRADTIYGATYLVLAPEHELVDKIIFPEHEKSVKHYQNLAKQKTELERKDESKAKTGVFTGSYATNPFTNEKMPIWIADYVLNNYGTGAIMAVPAHDPRDWEFAETFNLPHRFVIDTKDQNKAFVGEGKHINSDVLNGLNREEALAKIGVELEKRQIGKPQTFYKLRDWLFSRQRFYGEPFPLFYTEDGNIGLVDLTDLPITLPNVPYVKPTNAENSPLAAIPNWINTEYKGQKVRRDANTMPNSAGSSWYFLAYLLTDKPNELIALDSPAAKTRFEKWLPVDLYIGGQEHAVGHLLYARFWMHVLHDLGLVPVKEPFQRLFNQGMILGPDGRKMSKSWGNVINPDDIVRSHGADTLRLYEMFMGPLDASLPWSYDGLDAALKWLDRAYRFINNQTFTDENNGDLDYVYNDVVQKVTKMFNDLKLNTAISQLMILLNAFYKAKPGTVYRPYVEGFVKMLAPFAPHIASELWEMLGHHDLVVKASWPQADLSKVKLAEANIAIQVNGKLRGSITMPLDAEKTHVLKAAKAESNVAKFLDGHSIVKEIVIPNKIVNFVVKPN